VQLTFLQRTLGTFKLVPWWMGCRATNQPRAGVPCQAGEGADTMMVPATIFPLSGRGCHENQTEDARAIEDTKSQLTRNCERRVWEACGCGPTSTRP